MSHSLCHAHYVTLPTSHSLCHAHYPVYPAPDFEFALFSVLSLSAELSCTGAPFPRCINAECVPGGVGEDGRGRRREKVSGRRGERERGESDRRVPTGVPKVGT